MALDPISLNAAGASAQPQAVFAKKPVTPVAPVQARAAQPVEDVNNRVAELNQALASGQVGKDPGKGALLDVFA